MAPNPELNAKLKEMEARLPDPEAAPEDYRRGIEAMTRVTEKARAFAHYQPIRLP